MSATAQSGRAGMSLAPSAHLRRRNLIQLLVTRLMGAATLISILVTVGIVLSLLPTTFRLLQEITTQVFGTVWAPLFTPSQYGMAPLLTGTFIIVSIAMVIAIPIGLASAIFLSDLQLLIFVE